MLEHDTALLATKDVFAEIIGGTLPASVVYRDEHVLAFLDIQPINEGHTLIVPVRPARFLEELDDALAAHLFVVGRKVARALRASDVPGTGICMFLADGATAGQETPRVHLHVFPRVEGDGFGLMLPERYFSALLERRELDEIALKLRSALSEMVPREEGSA